jgi:hypothetical protein
MQGRMLLAPLLPAVSASGMDQAERQQDGEAGGPGEVHGCTSATWRRSVSNTWWLTQPACR